MCIRDRLVPAPLPTVRRVLCRWCCCAVGVTLGLAAAAGGQVAFRAPGVCPSPPVWLWTLCACCFFPGVRVQSHALSSVTLRTVWCCVFLCWVVLVVAGRLGPCSCAPVLVLLVRGPAFRLGVCLLEFPAVVCTVTPIFTIQSLCNVEGRTSEPVCCTVSVGETSSWQAVWCPTGIIDH